jgi:hypothetical protein
MSHDDFAFEHAPGLPAPLPRGETVLWQGRPATFRLAVEAFGLNWLAFYFAVVIAWRASVGFGLGGIAGAFAYGLPYVGLALAAAAVVLVLAWAQARATVYTLTTARVVMRVGAALSVTLQVPFNQIASAGLDLRRGGTGTIAIRTRDGAQLGYAVLWPHVRPWAMRDPEPALRCIPDAARVAGLLAEAAETRVSQPVIAGPVPMPVPAE